MNNGNVLAEVEDNGIGIPKDVFPNIFQPFFTTKPEGEGTGFGLYVCYSLMKQYGSIEAISNDKTIFKIEIKPNGISQ